jgi:hypothetical protein
VILTKAAIFAAGYVVGTRAGRERYAQIMAAAARASRRLEEYSDGRPGERHAGGVGDARRHA